MGSADQMLGIYCQPNGTFRLLMTEMAVGSTTVHTCPFTFSGQGYFRLAITWADNDVVVAGGGQIVGATSPQKETVQIVAVVLKPDLAPLNTEEEPKWVIDVGHHDDDDDDDDNAL